MKKIVALVLLTATLLTAMAVPAAAAETPTYSLSSRIELKTFGDYATHGNHQTRTVHTSHGDYAAYITSSYTDGNGNTVDKWSLIKINTATNKSTVVFTGEKYFDSSQVSLLVDKDENVWAITSTSDSKRNLSAEGLDCRAHRLDAKTGEVTSYTSIIGGGAQDGYGYATCYYDEAYDRIIVMHAGGDYVAGQNKASFNWTIFDLKKNQWQTRVRYAMIDSRHCYMFGYADGKGGLILIAQRDIKAASLGYPEISNNTGLNYAEQQYMQQNGITRWAADYCWDQLDLYYFPKITESKYTKYSVCEADYSKVKGTQEERYTLAKRLSNYYPATQNNNGGDFLLTKTADGRSLLHITYNKALIQAAMDRSKGSESKWYHQVWDVTDGADGCVKLYDGVLVDEMAGESGFGFRLYEDTKGNVNIIQSHNGALTIYRTEYNGKGGYNYHKVGETKTLTGAGNMFSISSHRGGSITDDKMNIIYTSSGKYMFYQATLSSVAYEPVECQHVWTLSEAETRPATCTGVGYDIFRCTYCNVTKRVDTPAKGHTLVITGEAPTCTEDGYEKTACSVCGRNGTEVLPATGHNFVSGSCLNCGEADPDFKPVYSRGDLNGDGQTNAMDANIIRRILSGTVTPEKSQYDAADMNGDGKVNNADANLVTRLVSGRG